MADFQTEPNISQLYTTIMSVIRDKDISLAKMDYTGWTNIPTGAIRINTSDDYKPERWNGSSWVTLDFVTNFANHIADASIHQTAKVGMVEMISYGTPDAGRLMCDGTAYSRITYATLFSKIGTTYGAGDGTTTFNVPNFKKRIPIGVDSATASIDTLGKTTGSFDHSHTTPNHSHNIASHTHDMANHTHNIGAHSHSINDHNHAVPAHYHYATANGGDINITSSGTHDHNYGAKEGGSNGSGAQRAQGASSSTGSNTSYTTSTTGSPHVHGSVSFAGRVGNTSGSNGDASFNTGGSGTLNTNSSSAYDSGTPSTNTTGGSGTLNTDTSGGGTTGTANPPVLAMNFQIIY